MKKIVILPDGTWMDLPGCEVQVLTEEQYETLKSGVDPTGMFRTYDLGNPVHLRLLADSIESDRR